MEEDKGGEILQISFDKTAILGRPFSLRGCASLTVTMA